MGLRVNAYNQDDYIYAAGEQRRFENPGDSLKDKQEEYLRTCSYLYSNYQIYT